MARILAVDPGEVRIGLAISDPLAMVARPYKVLQHENREADAARVLQEALANEVAMIIVGLPLDQEGRVGAQARKSLRLVETMRELSSIQIKTWDESGTTKKALEHHDKDEMLDARAAAFMLQDYLDAQA